MNSHAKSIGIFGGTFNPPHIAHVAAAEAFSKRVDPDVLMIIPDFIPPHKTFAGTVTPAQRLEMCKIAFSIIPCAVVSDLEIARKGKSYTYLTLQELTNDDTELYFLCGTDMILTMDNWKNPEIIFSLANICYIRRESDANKTALIEHKCKEYFAKYGATVLPIDAGVIEISSSEIRNDFANASKYLSSGVIEYITEAGLYK